MTFDTAGIEQLLREIAAILEGPFSPGPDLSAIPADLYAPCAMLQGIDAAPDTSNPGSRCPAIPAFHLQHIMVHEPDCIRDTFTH